MSTSFKKRVSSKPSHPLGTRPSLHNAQLLVSSGVPSLDVLLGGGLAVGTVLLIEEDTFSSYSRLLLKYFLSEGVMCGHALFLASASERGEDIIKDLPGCVDDTQNALLPPPPPQVSTAAPSSSTPSPPTQTPPVLTPPSSSDDDPQMKIAWRYQGLPKVQSSFSSRFGHFFDLTSSMDPSRLEAIDRTCFNAGEISTPRDCQELYQSLQASIDDVIQKGQFSVDISSSKQRKVLRVALQSLGSPLWLDEGGVVDPTHSLPRFLHRLRALLRRAYAVAMVTVPTHLMQDGTHVKHLERLCDAVVRLEAFAGSDKEQNPLYKDYHGLFHLCKLPCLNSLISHFPETLDLAFKLKRKKFLIEKLHLPPELSETASRAQEDQDSTTRAKRKPLTLTTTTPPPSSSMAADSGHAQSTRSGNEVRVGVGGGGGRTILRETAAAGSEVQLTGGPGTGGGVAGSRTKSATGRTGKLASHNIDF